MRTNVIIIDDFYNNPDQVRNCALSMQFTVTGNFPGQRTTPVINQYVKDAIQNLIRPHGGEVKDWMDAPHQYTGSFQYCVATDRTWIHADIYNTWAGVCYLTPDAPLNSGTQLYKHKATGQSTYVDSWHNGHDTGSWEPTDYIANKFNRLVLYRGDLFHASHGYFGDNLYNARLFQTFFINTEY
jgi:hypothetical protein